MVIFHINIQPSVKDTFSETEDMELGNYELYESVDRQNGSTQSYLKLVFSLWQNF